MVDIAIESEVMLGRLIFAVSPAYEPIVRGWWVLLQYTAQPVYIRELGKFFT